VASTSETRRQEDAFVAAVRAVLEVVEARDAAVKALTDLADSLVVNGGSEDYGTFDKVVTRPLKELFGWYHPQTFELWGEVGKARDYLANDGAGSGFEFDPLLTEELADIAHAFRGWLAAEEARPRPRSIVDPLLLAFDEAGLRRAPDEDRDEIAARLASTLRRELHTLEQPTLAAVGGSDDGH
jgi:hypothetical protein